MKGTLDISYQFAADVLPPIVLGYSKTSNLNGRIAVEVLLVRELLFEATPIAVGCVALRDFVGEQTEICDSLSVVSQQESISDFFCMNAFASFMRKAFRSSSPQSNGWITASAVSLSSCIRNQMLIITLLVNDLYSASISARRSLLSGCTLLIASSKRRASLPLSTGVSAISRAIIKYVFKLNILCKGTKNYLIL